MTKGELTKELELLADSCDSYYALEVNGYNRGVLDALDVVNKYFALAPIGSLFQQPLTKRIMKLDLDTLKQVKFTFDIHSDHSTMCNGYYSLCRMIEESEIEQNHKHNPKADETNVQ